ncbi:MAG: hypothetical protein DSM106950_41180 [Stigonema ocellatum SAG 48.90 = DSM 106950]|nr:hypothetical protein [Stigonema ocellatum SAG 48.90 = DSM 106950]
MGKRTKKQAAIISFNTARLIEAVDVAVEAVETASKAAEGTPAAPDAIATEESTKISLLASMSSSASKLKQKTVILSRWTTIVNQFPSIQKVVFQ